LFVLFDFDFYFRQNLFIFLNVFKFKCLIFECAIVKIVNAINWAKIIFIIATESTRNVGVVAIE